MLEVDKIKNEAEELTVRFLNTLTVRAVLPENRNTAEAAPVPIIKSLQVMLALIVTVWPFAMVTSLVLVGTPVGVQIAALVQLPEAMDVLPCP